MRIPMILFSSYDRSRSTLPYRSDRRPSSFVIGGVVVEESLVIAAVVVVNRPLRPFYKEKKIVRVYVE
jgi:hypothetical protein